MAGWLEVDRIVVDGRGEAGEQSADGKSRSLHHSGQTR